MRKAAGALTDIRRGIRARTDTTAVFLASAGAIAAIGATAGGNAGTKALRGRCAVARAASAFSFRVESQSVSLTVIPSMRNKSPFSVGGRRGFGLASVGVETVLADVSFSGS
jgi:hypothetical protein